MNPIRVALLAAVPAACGAGERFADDYVSAYCEAWLDCPNPEAVFDGRFTESGCVNRVAPGVLELAERCRVRRPEARACLEGLRAVGCPSRDQPFDELVPAVCDATWFACTTPLD